MCRSVAWGRGESPRVSPVLVITRHPLLGGTLEVPLADLARPLRVLDVTPRQEKHRVWSLALCSSRRKLTLRASSAAQYAKWKRLTRQWLQLGREMSASVVTASPAATATSDTTVAYHRRRRSPRLPATAFWEFETKAVVDSPVPWHLEMLPSPLSSHSSATGLSESTTYFTATTDPPSSGSRIRLDSNESTGDGAAPDPPTELPPDTGGHSRSVYSLLQALQAQEASLETVSSARTSRSEALSDDLSVGPLSELTTDSARITGVSLSIGDSASVSASTDWAHPTGRAPSSASLSSWLSESDQELDDFSQRTRALAMLEPPPRRRQRKDDSDEEQAEGEEEHDDVRDDSESFDYEASFPWIFTDAPDRRVVVITGPENQAVYFF
jgi:hypothetical protein